MNHKKIDETITNLEKLAAHHNEAIGTTRKMITWFQLARLLPEDFDCKGAGLGSRWKFGSGPWPRPILIITIRQTKEDTPVVLREVDYRDVPAALWTDDVRRYDRRRYPGPKGGRHDRFRAAP